MIKKLGQIIATNWPLAAAGAVMIGLFVAKNKGLLTADQVDTVLVLLGLGGTGGAHRLPVPGQS